jgi:hypothetical protein
MESFNNNIEPIKYLKEINEIVDSWQMEFSQCEKEKSFY